MKDKWILLILIIIFPVAVLLLGILSYTFIFFNSWHAVTGRPKEWF